ncbi:unnamed protein product [Phytophthora fragariaefolia]|uniref:Unnamed protein product n=1 Tax=Phytophthora fragariaefolia TaxID=1490495 RepID=A0A9W6Y9G2_9STRA|nr:unnamed protein product [Phytophthora fragariaefolia]
MVLARDELEALFDVGSDADIEDGEEEDEVPSSSTRVDPSVRSRRPREDDSDASGSKRSRWTVVQPAKWRRLHFVQYCCVAHWSSARPMDADSKRDPISLRHSDGTGTRKLPVEAECPSGRHSVKAGVLSLKTTTATQLATTSANAMNASPSAQRLSDCTGVQSKRVFRARCQSHWGWRWRENAAGLVRQTPPIAWRLLNASRRLCLPRYGRYGPN